MIVGAIDLDLGPVEARLGLAAGERAGPVGQVFGYWAPDLWPAQVWPSILLTQLEPLGRPSSAVVRWPAAFAGIIAGWMLTRRILQVLGIRAAVLGGICWFGSLAMIDRSGASGLDLILGLATLATIDRLMARGSDLVAGLWASLGVPGWRLASAGCNWDGDRRARQNHGGFLAPPAPSTTVDGVCMVVLDLVVSLQRSLGGCNHAATDAEAVLVFRLRITRPGSAVEPVWLSRHLAARFARAGNPTAGDG